MLKSKEASQWIWTGIIALGIGLATLYHMTKPKPTSSETRIHPTLLTSPLPRIELD